MRHAEETSPILRLLLPAVGFVLILGLTGGLSWFTRDTLKKTQLRFVKDISAVTSFQVEQHFKGGVLLLEELKTRAASRHLKVDDPDKLGRYFAERLRYTPDLAWISYSHDKDGRFIGAWRQLDGTVVLNTSHPVETGGRPVEQVIAPDGSTRPLERKVNGPYDPRKAPWYTAAAAQHATYWQPPFMFNEGRLGVTAARALRHEKSGKVRGVFTADFFVFNLSRFLAEIQIGDTGKVLVFDRSLSFFLPHDRALNEPDPLQDELRRTAMPLLGQLRPGETEMLTFEMLDQEYLVALRPLEGVGDPNWICALVVPSQEVLQVVRYSPMLTAAVIVVLLMILLVRRRAAG